MAYRVEFRPAAARDLKKLGHDVARRIVAKTEALGVMPRPPGAKKLEGHDRRYRVRVGEYRIVYDVEDAVLLVLRRARRAPPRSLSAALKISSRGFQI